MSHGDVTPDGTGSGAPPTPPQWQALQDGIKQTVNEVSDLRSKFFTKLQALRVAQFEMRGPVERMRQQLFDHEGSVLAVRRQGAPCTAVNELKEVLQSLTSSLDDVLVDLPHLDRGAMRASSGYENPRVAFAFGLTLLSARTAQGLSQDELSALCGLDRTYPSLMERGLRGPSVAMLLRLADGLGVEPAWLVTETVARLRQGK
jgi:ribosome-binding protein aMBF1 (putative translation factor)